MATRPLEYSVATNPGLQRDNNEDTFLSLPEHGLWLVADGMGGHEAGEVASAIVRDTLSSNPQRNLEHLIQEAHRAVLSAVDNGIGAPGMGSTIVALHSSGHEYEVSWVGDSRAYLWTHTPEGGRLEQLTTDHSYVQMLLASGVIRADEVEGHPNKNIITQCLGSSELEAVNVDTIRGEWRQDQWILLCSDGLTDEVDDKAMAQILCESHSPKAAVSRLLQQALNNGGRDNITLQLIESPLTRRRRLSLLWQWVPAITGRRSLDIGLCSLGLAAIALLLYALLN